jgi:hypothetical protein
VQMLPAVNLDDGAIRDFDIHSATHCRCRGPIRTDSSLRERLPLRTRQEPHRGRPADRRRPGEGLQAHRCRAGSRRRSRALFHPRHSRWGSTSTGDATPGTGCAPHKKPQSRRTAGDRFQRLVRAHRFFTTSF